MTRSEFDSRIKGRIGELVDDWYLPKDARLAYFQRLIKPYEKKGEKHYFIMQYLEADGHELSKKFWSIHSSSRFAFELYSWMANEKSITDFCFEKILCGLNQAEKSPNMDVYIEKGDDVYFIESKFREQTAQSLDGLSEAYYRETKDASSKRGLVGKLELMARYHDDERAYTEFPSFIEKVKQFLSGNQEKSCWMDFKQEITHLVGIYFTVKNDASYRNKRIRFYNIYYDFGDGVNPLVKRFFADAREMMGRLLNGYCQSFEYDHMSAQELVQNGKIIEFDASEKAFGTEDQTIGDYLEKYFLFQI